MRLLLLAALLILAGCKTDLYSGLGEHEANEIVSVLLRAGIDADRATDKSGEVTVRVERERFAEAIETLRGQGYPRRRYANLGEVFEGGGLVSSQMEERARFVFAMSEELSRTISEIDGVLSARTHVVLPTSDPLSRDVTPSSASVFIRHAEAAPVDALAPQIKHLVANSIQGLDYGKVSVVFVPVPRPPEPEPAPAPPPAAPVAAAPLLAAGLGGGGLVLLLGRLLGRRARPAPFAPRPAE